jgi:hypothetical protein
LFQEQAAGPANVPPTLLVANLVKLSRRKTSVHEKTPPIEMRIRSHTESIHRRIVHIAVPAVPIFEFHICGLIRFLELCASRDLCKIGENL